MSNQENKNQAIQSLAGKTGVIFGVANKRSIAWGIAKACADAGANLYINYQIDRLRDNVEKLVETLPTKSACFECDASNDEQIDDFFAKVQKETPKIDFLLHSIAFAPREALQGSYLDTTREDFKMSLDISAYSLTALAQRAEKMMTDGGSIMAMTYLGAEKVVPNYNLMGVAKAALESSARYLSADLGKKNIRVNCISAGPVQTLAARGISGFTDMVKYHNMRAPMGRSCTLEELGALGVFLASDASASITGQTIYIDGGFNIVA